MTEQAELGFAGLLRQLRKEAQLTQEELAEAARVSQRAVSDLERGINRTARKDTALLLADALGLDGQTRDLFVAAARGCGPAEAVVEARHGACRAHLRRRRSGRCRVILLPSRAARLSSISSLGHCHRWRRAAG